VQQKVALSTRETVNRPVLEIKIFVGFGRADFLPNLPYGGAKPMVAE